jgi:uncharacterized protein involved in outer membrane biogenesis
VRKHIVLKLVAGFVGLVLLSVIIAVIYVSGNLNRHKDVIEKMVEEATGREMLIEGDLHLGLSLRPTVAVDGVSFGNAAWGTQPQMATVKSIEVKVALLPLLSGDILVERLILIEPDIFIETDAEGHGNWVFGESLPEQTARPEDEATAPGLPAVGVQEIEISEGRFRYHAGDTGQTTTLVIDRLSAGAEDTNSPLNLDLVVAYNGHAISASATLGALGTLLANQAYPLQVTIDTAGARITIEGELGQPMEGKGLALDLAMKTDSLGTLSGLAGTELPPLGPMEVSARLSDSEAGYQLEGLKARVGKTDVSGRLAAILTGKRPRVEAQLTSTNIDLADFTTAAGGAAVPEKDEKTQKEKRVFSDDPLPLDGLRSVDADVTLQADRVTAQGLQLQNVDLKLALDGGRLLVKPAKAQVAGGTISAGIDVDARGKVAGLTVTVDGSQIDRGRLIKEIKGSDIMSGGKTDLTLRLKGRGNSVRAMAAGLSGEVLVVAGEGRINNKSINLAGGDVRTELFSMINPFMKEEQYTTLKCGVVRYDIKDGMATTENGIVVETDKLLILGTGTINLKNEQLALLIESKPKEDVVKGTLKSLIKVGDVSLAGLVQVGGTLAEPGLELNPAGVLKQGASVTAAVATGGLSTLAMRLIEEATKDENHCLTAQRKPAPTSASTGKAEQSSPEEEKKKGGVGGFLKGVIGK